MRDHYGLPPRIRRREPGQNLIGLAKDKGLRVERLGGGLWEVVKLEITPKRTSRTILCSGVSGNVAYRFVQRYAS